MTMPTIRAAEILRDFAPLSPGDSITLNWEEANALFDAARRGVEADAEIAQIRDALTGDDYASLPSDLPTVRMAHTIRADHDKFRNQVRDTCQRAEKAEAGMAWLAECVIRERSGTSDPKGWIAQAFEYADDRNEEIVNLRAELAALKEGLPATEDQNARFAIEGCIEYGRQGVNPPPDDHWLAPFWTIGRQLSEIAALKVERDEAANKCLRGRYADAFGVHPICARNQGDSNRRDEIDPHAGPESVIGDSNER